MTEAQLQDVAIELARVLGWRVAHFRPARTEKGYRTPVSADGAGFVDLVLVGRGRVLFRELKSSIGRLSHAQRLWGVALRGAGADYDIWTPEDWISGRIEKALQ